MFNHTVYLHVANDGYLNIVH